MAPHGLVSGLTAEKAEALIAKLESAGAEAEDEPLKIVQVGPCLMTGWSTRWPSI